MGWSKNWMLMVGHKKSEELALWEERTNFLRISLLGQQLSWTPTIRLGAGRFKERTSRMRGIACQGSLFPNMGIYRYELDYQGFI